MLRLTLTAAILLACSPVNAEDPVDKALTQLGAEEIATREAASKVIEDAGAKALKRSEDLLAATKDPEVRVRLQALIPWLKIDATTPAFLKACGDQWFAYQENGVITGVEHHTADLSGEGAERRWTFAQEAWMSADNGNLIYARHRMVARHNFNWTPISEELHQWSEVRNRHEFWRFSAECIEAMARPSIDFDGEPTEEMWRVVKGRQLPAGPVVSLFSLERFAERAEIAGMGQSEPTVLILNSNRVDMVQVRFRPGIQEEFNLDGHQLKARTWIVESMHGEDGLSFLVSDKFGLVRGTELRNQLTAVEASDEKTCRETGLIRRPPPEFEAKAVAPK